MDITTQARRLTALLVGRGSSQGESDVSVEPDAGEPDAGELDADALASRRSLPKVTARVVRAALMVWDAACWLVAALVLIGARYDLDLKGHQWAFALGYVATAAAVHAIVGWWSKLYRGHARLGSYLEAWALARTTLIATVLAGGAFLLLGEGNPRGLPFTVPAVALTGMLGGRILARSARYRLIQRYRTDQQEPVLIYGAGNAGAQLANLLLVDVDAPYRVAGFIDDDLDKRHLHIGEGRVLGRREDLVPQAERLGVRTVIAAMPTAPADFLMILQEELAEAGVRLMVLPTVGRIVDGRVQVRQLHELQLDDLLERVESGEAELVDVADHLRSVIGAGGGRGDSSVVSRVPEGRYFGAPGTAAPESAPAAPDQHREEQAAGPQPTARVYLSSPDVTPVEEAALVGAMRSGWIAPLGPDVDGIEADLSAYTGRTHAVALSSGTAALHLGLLSLGVGPGDLVLTSSMTFAATANSIVYTGAEPVFVDSDESGNMSPALLQRAFLDLERQGRSVKAVVPVDLFGKAADHELIDAIASARGVPVLSDAAESLGATFRERSSAKYGRAAAVSFNGNKIMTTSGGGALLTDDEDVAAKVRYLATQARQPVVHYEHTDIGFNYRMSNLLAALGRAQLGRLDGMIERRREHRRFYRDLVCRIPGVTLFGEPDGVDGGDTRDNCWLTSIVIDPAVAGFDRTHLMSALAAENIEARPLWKPMHLQPVFSGRLAYTDGTSERLFETGLSLPSGSAMSVEQRKRVARVLLRVAGRG